MVIPWEMLGWQMELEEPSAASIISVALNKKSEAAMKTSHTEIMNCLGDLCNPRPGNYEVPWVQIRDKMVELYGPAVDHPDFFQAFRLLLDLGGRESPHVLDLREFVSCRVNAKVRKMRFEAYPLVTGYPPDVPKLKVASLKWAYKQETTRGWCQLPQSISHRLDKDSKTNMKIFIQDIDQVLCWMTKAANVLIKEGANSLNARTKWIAEVDVGIMNRIYEVPKQKEGMTVADQQAELAEECAGFFAKKLVALKGHVQSLSAVADADIVKHLATLPGIGEILSLIHI